MTAKNRREIADTAILLSLSSSGTGSDANLALLTDFAGDHLLSVQLRELSDAGFEHILVEVGQVSGRLLDVADRLSQENIDITFLHKAAEIPEKIGNASQLLVVADKRFVVAEQMASFARTGAASVWVVAADSSEAAFERIDLNNRWSGLALIPANRLAELGEIPAEWDVSSALLRHAIQLGAEMIPADGIVKNGGIKPLPGDGEVEGSIGERLDTVLKKENGLAEFCLFHYPAALLNRKMGAIAGQASLIACIFAAATLLLTIFEMELFALPAALFSLFARHVARQRSCALAIGERQVWTVIQMVLLVAALCVATWRDTSVPGILAALALAAALIIARSPKWIQRLGAILGSVTFAVLVIGIAILAGALTVMVQVLTLLLLGAVIREVFNENA